MVPAQIHVLWRRFVRGRARLSKKITSSSEGEGSSERARKKIATIHEVSLGLDNVSPNNFVVTTYNVLRLTLSKDGRQREPGDNGGIAFSIRFSIHSKICTVQYITVIGAVCRNNVGLDASSL